MTKKTQPDLSQTQPLAALPALEEWDVPRSAAEIGTAETIAGPVPKPMDQQVTVARGEVLAATTVQPRLPRGQEADITPQAPPDRWQRLAQLLQSEAAATASPRRAALLLYDLGRLYEHRLGKPDRARELYLASLERYPKMGSAFRALARLFQQQGEHLARVRLLEQQLGLIPAEERGLLLLAIAEVYRSELADPTQARAALERALKLLPDDVVVLEALEEVCRQLQDHPQLEEHLLRRSRLTEDPALRSALLFQAGRLREDELADLRGAEAHYRSALNTWPTNMMALQALLRTTLAAEDFPSAAKLYEALAEVESGPAAAATLHAASKIYRSQLRNPPLAIAALQRALQEAPADLGLLLDLAELFGRERRWAELEQTLAQAVSVTAEPGEAADLYYRLARVRQLRLQDSPGAIAALSSALELNLDHVPARRMLGRLYARNESWQELVHLLASERDHFSSPEHKAAISYRIGELCEQRLEDAEQALAAYQQTLALSPGYRPAVRGVSRLLEQLGRHQELLDCYTTQLELIEQREEQILLLRRMADIWERGLGDLEAAIAPWEHILQLEPSNFFALRALERLYPSCQRWSQQVELLKADADQSMDRYRRVSLLSEAAEIYEQQLADLPSALQTYEEVLDTIPTHQPALMAVGRILQREGRQEELLALHRRELEHSEDPLHRSWLLMKIGRLLEDRLGRPDQAAIAYEEALGQSHQLPEGMRAQSGSAADRLLQLYEQAGETQAQIDLLQRLSLPRSLPAQALRHRRLAELLLAAGKSPGAEEQLFRAVEAGGDPLARYQLLWLLQARGDQAALRTQLVAAAAGAAAEGPLAQQAAYHRLLLQLPEDASERELVLETLERIIEIAPADRLAPLRLELVYGQLQQWEKLVAVLELLQDQAEDIDYRLACTLLAAHLRGERLGDLTGAAHNCFVVLERRPTQPGALELLERHYRSTGNSGGLISILSRHAKCAQGGAERVAILTAMAATHARQGELERAAELYQTALESSPNYLPAANGLVRSARDQGDATRLAAALESRAAACNSDKYKAASLLEAGSLWQDEIENHTRAAAVYERVLQVAPDSREAIDRLAAIYSEGKEWGRLVELLQRSLLGQTPTELRNSLVRIADLQRSRLADLTAARSTISRALAYFPDDPVLLATLAELCRAQQDWQALAEVDLRLVSLTTDPVLLKALHFELGSVWEERLPDLAAAIAEYRRVLALDESDLGALTRLSELLVRAQEWDAAAKTTEALIQRDDDRTRIKQYYLRLAQILAEGFGNLDRSAQACRQALALDPGDLGATEALAAILKRAGDQRALQAHFASTLAVHRSRLERDPFCVESYQALRKIFSWQRAPDALFVVREILCAINSADAKDLSFVSARRPHAPTSPTRPLTVEEIEELLVHADERGAFFRLIAASEPLLRKIHPCQDPTLGRHQRVTSRSHPQLSLTLADLAKAMGGIEHQIYLVDGGLDQLRVEDTSPPALLLGFESLEQLTDKELTFFLARLLARIRLHHPLYHRLGNEGLGRTISALLAATCRSFASPFPAEGLAATVERLNKGLSRRQRRHIAPLALELSDRTIDPERWLVAMEHSEDRLALAATGDIQVALACVLRSESYRLQSGQDTPERLADSAGPRTRELMHFAVSEEYLTLRERLGMALKE